MTNARHRHARRRRRTGLRASVALALVALSGCVPVPVYKTLQPAATVHVVDPDGHAVSGAQVVLIATSYPFGFERSRSVALTDAAGAAMFDSRHEWRTELPMLPDGDEQFFWNWCVKRAGYATYLSTNRSGRTFDRAALIVLAPGESSACPQPPNR